MFICSLTILQTSSLSLFSHLSFSTACAISAIANREPYFHCIASDSNHSSLPTMSPETAQQSPVSTNPPAHLFDIYSHLESTYGAEAHQPTTYGGGTIYYYCCQCNMGPQVLVINPSCCNCYHHVSSRCCRYKKGR